MEYGGRAISATDFEILIAVTTMTNTKSVLEFGPGTSTHAFIKGGATKIDTFEADDEFYNKYANIFSEYPGVNVHLGEEYSDVEDHRYDIAFIDGPRGRDDMSRMRELLFATKHADIIILHDIHRKGEQDSLEQVRNMGYKVSTIGTDQGMAIIVKK